MPRLLTRFINILAYKEPTSKELGFELLEDKDEGNKQQIVQDNNQDDNQVHDEQRNDRKKSNRQNNIRKPLKHPMTVKEFNKSKTEKPSSAQDSSADISPNLNVNLETIRNKFHMPQNQDAIVREFKIGRKLKAFIVYIKGMIDIRTMNMAILQPLMSKDVLEGQSGACIVNYLVENAISVHGLRKANKYSDAIMQVLNGESALFIEGCNECILIETKGYEKRSVEQPITEIVVKGSQEGFTENLSTNVVLIRRIIKNENLVTEMLPVGNTNHSNCAVIYLKSIANPEVVQEVKKRLQSINTDFIMGDGMIEQFIEDNPFMLFPQTLTTERPDRSASFIMEGQVVILCEGSPFAITVPVTFFRLLHTSEDMFLRWPYGTFIRLIRLFGLFCATLLPGVYVALLQYHVEMLPTELVVSIAAAKEVVPFPMIVEVLIMEMSFELIREGGIRVPSIIGQTLGIVGALILGQAAVSANLVSPVTVIVVSITALGSFAIPNYELGLAIRIERFFFIFAAAAFGFYGISLLITLLACMACSMKSFGVPFFAPVAPRTKINPDVILRAPVWMQKNRPDALNTLNRKKQGDNKRLWISKDIGNTGRKGD